MGIIADSLATQLADNWWKLLLRGLVAIGFGVLTFMRPDITLAALLFMFGVYVLIDGFLAIWTAITGRDSIEHWVVLLLGGLLGVAVGVMTFMVPGITELMLQFYIALWAIATGMTGIIAGFRLRKEMSGEWVLILSGLVAAAFGVFLIARPIEGALSMLSIIAFFAVVYGLLLSILAFKVKGLAPAT